MELRSVEREGGVRRQGARGHNKGVAKLNPASRLVVICIRSEYKLSGVNFSGISENPRASAVKLLTSWPILGRHPVC